MQPHWTDTVPFQPLGIHHDYYRINLNLVRSGTIPRDTLLMAMVKSAGLARHPDPESWEKEWDEVFQVITKMKPGLPQLRADQRRISKRISKGDPVMHHSKIYERTYRPHYRIIHRTIFDAWLVHYFTSYP
jgi:hypothetical protein